MSSLYVRAFILTVLKWHVLIDEEFPLSSKLDFFLKWETKISACKTLFSFS